jgi:hypothetical protein
MDGRLMKTPRKEKKNQRHAIRYEFKPVGLTLVKNSFNARWGLLHAYLVMGELLFA